MVAASDRKSRNPVPAGSTGSEPNVVLAPRLHHQRHPSAAETYHPPPADLQSMIFLPCCGGTRFQVWFFSIWHHIFQQLLSLQSHAWEYHARWRRGGSEGPTGPSQLEIILWVWFLIIWLGRILATVSAGGGILESMSVFYHHVYLRILLGW